MKLKLSSFLKKYGKKPLLDVIYCQEVVFLFKEFKNGMTLEIKIPEEKDCASLVEMMRKTYEQSEFLTQYPDEFNISVEDEIKWISKFDQKVSSMLIVKDGYQVVGNAAINPVGKADKLKHRCTFGIAILNDYQGMGVGRCLTQEMIQFASKAGYKQIELEVVVRNNKAMNLYLSEGFKVYGTRPHHYGYRDGHYEDVYLMVKEL